MTTRLLCLGDLHLGPSDQTEFLGVELADSNAVDVVVTIGDVIDDNVDHADSTTGGEGYEERGRAYFEALDETSTPVVAVPGNHDPIGTTERLTEGLETVSVAHRERLDESNVPFLPGDLSFVGWGCEQFDLTQSFPYDYPAINPLDEATPDTIHHLASECTELVLSVLGRLVSGSLTDEKAIEELGIADVNRERAIDDLETIAEDYQRLRGLLAESNNPTVCLSHESPFGTELDRHHASFSLFGQIHTGSIALRLAITAASPVVTLSGHSHSEAHDVVRTFSGYRDVFNPGSPGVALVEFDTDQETVQIDRDPSLD